MGVNRAAGEPYLLAGVGDVDQPDAICWAAVSMDARSRAEVDAVFETPRLSWVRSTPDDDYQLMVPLAREGYIAAPFLDAGRALPHACEPLLLYAIPTQDLLSRELPPPEPLRLIFHVGHCGSTLLSRAIATVTECLPLREPPLLGHVADARRRSSGGARHSAVWEALAFALLQRRFPDGAPPVVKATSLASNLAIDLLARHAESRAIYLVQDLESHVLAMWKYADTDVARGHEAAVVDLAEVVQEGFQRPPAALVERIVVAWIGRMWSLHRADRAHPGRGNFLVADDFMADPRAALERVVTHLDLPQVADADALEGTLARDAKRADVAHSPQQRAEALAEGRRELAAELRVARNTAENLIARNPVLQPLARYLAR